MEPPTPQVPPPVSPPPTNSAWEWLDYARLSTDSHPPITAFGLSLWRAAMTKRQPLEREGLHSPEENQLWTLSLGELVTA